MIFEYEMKSMVLPIAHMHANNQVVCKELKLDWVFDATCSNVDCYC